MSRNLIVGLAVLVVAALSWIVIDQLAEGNVVDMQEDAVLQEQLQTEAVEGDAELVTEGDPDRPDVLAREPEPLEEQIENARENTPEGPGGPGTADMDATLTENDTVLLDREMSAGPIAEEVRPDTVDTATSDDVVVEETADGSVAVVEQGEIAVDGPGVVDEAAEAADTVVIRDAGGDELQDTADTSPIESGAEVGPIDEALLGIEGDARGVEGETVIVTPETAEALEQAAEDGTPATEDRTPGTAVPETETLVEGFVDEDEVAPQTVTDAELATDAIDARASDDAITEAMLAEVDPASVPRNTEELAALLTPETFDPNAILAYVLQSDAIDQVEKEALTVALQQAREQPEFVDAAILSTRRRFELTETQTVD
jgi:hypothetical protein